MQQFITADRRWEYTMRTPFSEGYDLLTEKEVRET